MRGWVAILAVALLAVGVGPATAGGTDPDGDVVAVPGAGEAALELLDDGTRVWVVRQVGGEVDVLAVAVDPLDPAASPFVVAGYVQGVRSAVVWLPDARRFIGGGVLFDSEGRALQWYPNQVGGADDAEPVPARDLDAYAVERVDEDHVRVGARAPGAQRMVPADPDGGCCYGLDEFVSPVPPPGDPGLLSVEEALDRPEGTVVVVDADVVVDRQRPVQMCRVPRVPVPDLPPCPEDAPVPSGVQPRDADGYVVEFGPYLVRVQDGTFAELVGGNGSAGRFGDVGPPPPGSRCPAAGVELLAIGAHVATAVDTPVCAPDAPAGIVLEVVVDSRRDTPEEDASVVAVARNDSSTTVHVAPTASVVRVHRQDDGQDLYQGALAGTDVPTVELRPGQAVEVLRSDPFPGSLQEQPGGTTAGRYLAALRTSVGYVRTTFFVELPGAF